MAQVNFRLDDQLKADGERLFKSMGMNLSVAISIFIQQSLLSLAFPVGPKRFYCRA